MASAGNLLAYKSRGDNILYACMYAQYMQESQFIDSLSLVVVPSHCPAHLRSSNQWNLTTVSSKETSTGWPCTDSCMRFAVWNLLRTSASNVSTRPDGKHGRRNMYACTVSYVCMFIYLNICIYTKNGIVCNKYAYRM